VTGGTKGSDRQWWRGSATAARVLTTARSRQRHYDADLFVETDITTPKAARPLQMSVMKGLGGIDIIVHVVAARRRLPAVRSA